MNELYHHGILGMHWGEKNGPPYPLDANDHSASENKAGWKKSLNNKAKEESEQPNKRYEGYTVEDGWYPDEKMYVANDVKTKDGQKVRVEFSLPKEKEFNKYKSISDKIVDNIDKVHENMLDSIVDDEFKYYQWDNGLKDTPRNRQRFRNEVKRQMKMDTIALSEYKDNLRGEAWFNGNPVRITELFGDHSLVVHFNPKNGDIKWVEVAG